MIENNNMQVAIAREIEEAALDAREDFLDKRGAIKVRRLTKYDDPTRFDKQFESVVREVETNVIDVDAKLMEGGKIHHYKNATEFMASRTVQERLQRARAAGVLSRGEISQAGEMIREAKSLREKIMGRQLREGTNLKETDFEYGYYPDERPTSGRYFPVVDVALPQLNSPHAKNALLVDYLDAHRKTWEAATFNPIARRITRLVPQFVLGRGVKGAIDSREHQEAWDEFHQLNRMRGRIKQSLKELLIYGEIFWRFFPTNRGLLVRSIDPSTIWDIVTEEDDIEAVRYYHQQYVRMEVNHPMPGNAPIPSTMIIRQIPAESVEHYKINATSSEKRGRSELFPILGYLLRFKEFVNDRIAINKMRAMFALDVSVEGGRAEVAEAEAQFSTPPGPAAVLVHNAGVAVDFKNTSANAGDAVTDAETLLKVIAIGANISENFLGVTRSQTRAGALISTEPDVKNFEDYQELVEEILMDAATRVFKHHKLSTNQPMEFTFPAIAQEDRSAKIKDIAFMESMDYFGKERAATMAAREFQISDYNFKAEQQRIRQERATSPVIATGLQQVDKIMPAEGGDAQPGGLGPDLKPAKDRVTQTSGEMGFKADLGGRGLPNTKATLNRSGFTRGGEKLAIKNNRTSGTPLRHAAGEPGKGWNADARAASLLSRRQARLKRLTEAADTALAEGRTRRHLTLLRQIEETRKLME